MTQHILKQDGARPTTVKCPKCGDIVVYNGNFFCNSFDRFERFRTPNGGYDIRIVEGTCDWALPYPVTAARDAKVVTQLIETGQLTGSE